MLMATCLCPMMSFPIITTTNNNKLTFLFLMMIKSYDQSGLMGRCSPRWWPISFHWVMDPTIWTWWIRLLQFLRIFLLPTKLTKLRYFSSRKLKYICPFCFTLVLIFLAWFFCDRIMVLGRREKELMREKLRSLKKLFMLEQREGKPLTATVWLKGYFYYFIMIHYFSRFRFSLNLILFFGGN